MYRACLLGILTGCGHEYALSSLGEAQPISSGSVADDAPDSSLGSVDPNAPDLAIATADLPGLAAPPPAEADADEPADHTLVPEDIELTLGGGARAQVADFLFVIDSSSSMQRVLGRVLDGFDALASEGAFPSDARIAVMSTLPADPTNRAEVHPAAPPHSWLRSEPGFGHLVDKDRIAIFRALAPEHISERFAHEGCDAWFTPSQRNADGIPCLVANSQLALYPFGVEAGLLALQQIIQSDTPLFRTGAAVNVIIVSDTHDPGLPGNHPHFAELSALRPAFADIERSALRRQDLASFRLHAVAPAEVCTAEDWSAAGPVYFEAATLSGGEILDVCDALPNEYVDLVRKIATSGAIPQRAVVPLAQGDRIEAVLVDGLPIDFALSTDKRAVILKDLSLSASHGVSIRYRRPAVPPQEIADPLGDETAAAE